MKRFSILVSLILVLLLVLSSSIMAQDDVPALGDLEAGVWTQISPGGDTVCAQGDEYSFFVRPAEDSNKLMIHFQGGGACWDDGTCLSMNGYQEGGQLYKDLVSPLEGGSYQYGFFGADAPTADYNIVMVNYCSADIHWGNNSATYTSPVDGSEYTIEHKGAVNAQAVLDWAYDNFAEPENVLVSGCSAGAYGSLYHASNIFDHYAGVPADYLNEGFMVAFSPVGFDFFSSWNPTENLPEFATGFDPETFTAYQMMVELANAYPDIDFGTVNSFADNTMIFFAALQNGIDVTDEAALMAFGQEWVPEAAKNFAMMNAGAENYYTLINGGSNHCILANPAFYAGYETNGVMLSDWVSDLIDGEPSDVSCDVESGECFVAPVEIEE